MQSKSFWWPALAVLVVAVAVRVHGLATTPLWTDELFTRAYPDAGLGYLWGEGFRAEPTPPLYYTLIAAIERVFGDGAVALRLPSVVGSIVSVFVAWRLGLDLFRRSAPALVAAALLALAPISVFYAQEARAYALQGAALGVALLAFARVLRGAPGLWPYAVAATLAMWLHPTSAIALVGFNVGAVVAKFGRDGLKARALWRWLGANLLVALACLPLLPGLLFPPASGAATSWIPVFSRWTLENVIGETLAGPALILHAQRIAEIATVCGVLLFLLPPWRPGRRALIVLAVVPLTALVLMVGVSLFKPILLSRTLAWLLLPLAVALGDVLSRRSAVFGAALVGLLAAALAMQIAQGPHLKEDWPGLFATMPDLAPPTLLVFAPHTPPTATALYGPPGLSPSRLDDGVSVPETTIIPQLFHTPTIDTAVLAAKIRAGDPVWLIYRRPEYDWVKRTLVGLPPATMTRQSEPGPNPSLTALFWLRAGEP